jgi:hypothetical protein
MTSVKKSAPAMVPQCAHRNVCHDVGRLGSGEFPCALRIRAIVDRPTRCPRFFSAPRIRVVSRLTNGVQASH